MANTAVLSFRMPSAIKQGLQKEAMADERSVSSLVERVLRNWLEQRGHHVQEHTREEVE